MVKEKISIVVPVYNEQRSVISTFKRIKKTIKKNKHNVEIIAVNDCSKDKSGKILESIKDVKVIHHPINKGYGASLKTGIKNAKGDWILITDADGTYPIEDIPKLLFFIDKYDMVVGSRTGRKVSIPFFRKPAKWFLNNFASYLAGANIPDLNSGLRIFKKDIAFKFWTLFPQGFSFTSTITMACFTNNYNVKYIPINYFKRKGKSTIHPIKDFIGFINLLIRLSIYFNPIKFFFFPGILVMLIGIFFGIYSIINWKNITDVSVLLFLSGLQICFMGLISDLISKTIKK